MIQYYIEKAAYLEKMIQDIATLSILRTPLFGFLKIYCDPIVWFPEEICTTFHVFKILARMIKVLENFFLESIPFNQLHPDRRRPDEKPYRNIQGTEHKLTRFQLHPETELACK